MRRNIYHLFFAALLSVFFLPGCTKWEDHNALTDPNVGKDLFQQITENAELSKFAELLSKSGYDKTIASSKTFTVFAPTNAALANVDPNLVNDSARLRAFIANHISNQSFFTNSGATTIRLQMLNGKYNNLVGKKLEDANIITADRYAKNGVLQVIDKMLPALPNAWELLETSPLITGKQKNYLLSLYRKVFDPTNANQIGVDPTTGRPVYEAGTDSVRTNLFWRDVHDLRNEQKQFTLFVLADGAWDAEVNKFKPFFATGNVDSTTNLSNWAVVKDFTVDTVYQPASIPDTIMSKFNTKVGIEKSAIAQTIKTSNGIVYIMNKVDVRPKDKFMPYIIEAENYRFTSEDRRANTYFRDRINPVTRRNFRDVLVYNHGLALFNLAYRVSDVPSIKYKAFWVAVHDNINNSTATFTQKLGIGSPTSATLSYVTVPLNNYDEVFLGEFTMSKYSPLLDIYLTAANSNTAPANTIVCDYIRLEPSL